MRVASIFAASALALGFIHSHALAQEPSPRAQPTISQREQARNTYIFKFDESVSRDEMHARALEIVGRARGRLRHVYTEVLGGFSATIPGAAVWSVAGEPGIVAYKRDEIVSIAAPDWCAMGHWKCEEPSNDEPVDDPDSGPTDPEPDPALNCSTGGNQPWGVERINAGDAHAAGNCGQGIHVYVIDTGIDLDHPNLKANIGASWTCFDKVCEAGGEDDHGHGTHVAGTIGAVGGGSNIIGVAPSVTLHSVKVLDATGYGYQSDIIAALNKVAEQVTTLPVVANLSLGGSGQKSDTCSANSSSYSDPYHKAFCDAAQAGVVIVAAAGNSGADAANFVPAAYDDAVITASATDSSDKFPRWSNWGNDSATWASTNSAPVAIAAPGVSVVSTKMGGGTTTKSGTSMASPHVAGVAAILLQKKLDSDGIGYSTDYTAFDGIREDVLGIAAESFDAKGKNPHDEKFLCAVVNC